ncbi:nucleotidyltransferase domain-containing protein [bacterium]|nr:nucleotidyltransferase domain-containing protein [bacterium]
MTKIARLAAHIRYADAHGCLAEIDRFLRGLREEEWAHLADFGTRAHAPSTPEREPAPPPVTNLVESTSHDLEVARTVLSSWAAARSFVNRLWIYGSRAKGTHSSASDLDVAIDFDAFDNEDRGTTWVCEGQRWQDELQASLPWRLQLEWYDPDGSTPRIASGISDGGILVYERVS